MVFLWFSYGFPMVFLWFSYGFPMVFLWFSYGFPMVYPENRRRISLLSPGSGTYVADVLVRQSQLR